MALFPPVQSDLRKEHSAIGIGGKMFGHVMLSSSLLISLIVLFLHELGGKGTFRQRLWREEPLAMIPTTFRHFLG
jgi:hypothetical protein